MGAAIIDFRVCPPLVKCKNLMFSRFIDMLLYGFSSTGVTINCYFGLKFMITPAVKWFVNGDIMIMIWQQINYLVCIFFLITVIFPYKISINPTWYKTACTFFSFLFFCCFSSIRKKGNQINILCEIRK
jgi:hypothetical protein